MSSRYNNSGHYEDDDGYYSNNNNHYSSRSHDNYYQNNDDEYYSNSRDRDQYDDRQRDQRDEYYRGHDDQYEDRRRDDGYDRRRDDVYDHDYNQSRASYDRPPPTELREDRSRRESAASAYSRRGYDAQDSAYPDEKHHNRAPYDDDNGGYDRNYDQSAFQDLEYGDNAQDKRASVTSTTRDLITPESEPEKLNEDEELQRKIDLKRRGQLFVQKRPYVAWFLTFAMIVVMFYEWAQNWRWQGTPFSMKPYINPLLGPSQSALITFGARFTPCMKHIDELPADLMLGCPSNTDSPPSLFCTIDKLCAFGGFKGKAPNQWFRFIIPIFIHGGAIHIIVNMFVQMTVGAEVEKEMGSIGFFLVYISAGIFGNVLGGNFSMVGLPSVGASGALFGAVSSAWVDLAFHWKYEYQPGRKLAILSVEFVFAVLLGFVPGVDNFAHLGGFLLGVLTSIALYPIICETSQRKRVVFLIKFAAVILGVVLYTTLIINFYTGNPYKACSWCRYISCIPTSANDYCKGTGIAFEHTTADGMIKSGNAFSAQIAAASVNGELHESHE